MNERVSSGSSLVTRVIEMVLSRQIFPHELTKFGIGAVGARR